MKNRIKEIVGFINQSDAMSLYRKYYDNDVEMKSPGEPLLIGRERCISEHEIFFSKLVEFKSTVLTVTYNDFQSMLEVLYKLKTQNGMEMSFRGVAVHEWKHGLITNERFYKDEVFD